MTTLRPNVFEDVVPGQEVTEDLFNGPYGFMNGLERKNLLYNDGRVWQRGTSSPTVSDNNYALDRWRLMLGAANAATIARETSSRPTGGGQAGVKLTVGSGVNNKFGMLQVIPSQDVLHLRGQTVSLQATMRASTGNLTNTRMAVLQWTSTADGTTGDPISAWNSSGTAPTLASNWTYLTDATESLDLTDEYATYTLTGITVGDSMTNLAVFFWSDATSTVQTTDALYIFDWQLEAGDHCSAVERKPYGVVLHECRGYYQRYVGPGNNNFFAVGQAYAADSCAFFFPFRPPLVKLPTATAFSASSAIEVVSADLGTAATGTVAVAGTSAVDGCAFTVTGISGSPLVAGNAAGVRWVSTASYLEVTTEI